MHLENKILLKAMIDYILVIISMPMWLFVMAFIAIGMKILQPSESIFFKQKRIGRFNKAFDCYKFRSMYKNGHEILIQYLKENPDEVEHYKRYHKYRNDPRITKIGHFIRKTSLDELPQLFNVLKLEMSLVGPRPYMIAEKKKIGANIKKITSVRPGLTGLWQVSGGNKLSFHDRVDLDCRYVDNISILGDILILIKTIKIVFKNQ